MAVEERTAAEAAIVNAVRDYFEGWFDGDVGRMERALHPGLAKRSLERDGRTLNETTAEWMIDATARELGRERDPGDRRIEVEVEDVYGTIANATVRSAVYREYVQLRADVGGLEDRERALGVDIAKVSTARSAAEEALLDAAERVLVDVGYAGITTRRLAEEAGVNHGLVHYYFGSVENLLVRMLERFTERQIARQREMYAADMPFLEKWRTAMRYLMSEDFAYEKVWLELQALAWNRPELRERVHHVNAEWRAVLMEALAEPREQYGIEMPLEALVSLVMTFNEGIILERLSGVTEGHEELLDWIDAFLEGETMTIELEAPQREQTRARYPDESGYVERDGVRVFYEVYGQGEPTVFLLPTWSIIHSRHWKMQIPYLARHYRVVTFDGRGNGRSDRPDDQRAYAETEFAADALAVMDATATESAVIVAFSLGAQRGLLLAAEHPERVEAAVFIGPAYPGGGSPLPERIVHSWEDELDTEEDWAMYNKHYWLRDYRGFLEFFMSRMFTEPHSTKPIEDTVAWGLDTTGETLVLAGLADRLEPERARGLAGRVRCSVLVIHGIDDAINSHTRGTGLAEHTGGRLVLLEGSGHAPHVRDPVKVNLLLRDFVKPPPPRRWARGKSRRKRALYISSPIGLGHAQRDAAIADELRKIHPDLEIDWLAQNPVTAVLEKRGERIHAASACLANESGHIESESAEHDLHCFQAIRRMDEILLANFMVFHDLVREEDYDLWIGDEAWELDYYLHENPEQKRAAYVWLTDFVGWLPMSDGGEREAFLTADYNAEMIEHIARFSRIRDRALYVGNADDIVPDAFGPGLPLIREWTEDHYDLTGYVTGFDPAVFSDREALRAELGYAADEKVCIVTVGGSGVGVHLLRRVIDAFPEAKEHVPALRMIVVAGPRIDPATLPQAEGLEIRRYVHDLYRHLAACDLAVVQGGLTTSMELTANRRPFIYFPLHHHFEQNFHVRHRLERYGAGRCMDFATATPETIARAIADEIGRVVDYRPVETDGAARAAALIAELL